MNPGRMNKRIIILRSSDGNNSFVKPLGNESYVPYKQIWSKVEHVSAKEIFNSKANNTLNVVKFIIRYRKDIKSDMRIKYDSHVYEIKGIRPLDTKKMYLMLIGELIQHE
jgi:SPP1 family predicted phage head-tail adaptor